MDELCPKCHRPYNGKHCFKCGYVNKENIGKADNQAQEKTSSMPAKMESTRQSVTGSTSADAANALFARYKKNALKSMPETDGNQGIKEGSNITAAKKPEEKPVQKANDETPQMDSKLSAFQQYYKKTMSAQPADNGERQHNVQSKKTQNADSASKEPTVTPTNLNQNMDADIHPETIQGDSKTELSSAAFNVYAKETSQAIKQNQAAGVKTAPADSQVQTEDKPELSEEDAVFDSMFHPKDPDIAETEKTVKKKTGLFGKKDKEKDDKQTEKDKRLENAYNQNEDHYYDDTEPYYEAERQKFTLEDGLKIFGMILGVFLLIVFLIFYL